ncbi:hypothetical protein J1N35_035182 [Gossypium stocksii]|uniref:Uncharacterized protein n=1 Tax=Gossypium stocksii TaxID=47602 RepID=A0A9D3UTG3_9ROSI|nr:hypothetical protein J1N35_035182 [Gossypium stocksii]
MKQELENQQQHERERERAKMLHLQWSAYGDDDLEEEAVRLGSIIRVFKPKKAKKSEKKSMKYFLCYGPHRLQDCPEQSKLSAISKGEKAEPDKIAVAT